MIITKIPSIETGTLAIADRVLPYTIKRSAKRKRTITLKIINDQAIILSPMRTPQKRLIDFLKEREVWIQQQLVRQAERKAPLFCIFDSGQSLVFMGETKSLRIDESGTYPNGCQIMGDVLHVALPSIVEADERHYRIWRLLIDWYRRQAEQVFTERLDRWCDIMELCHSGLSLSNAKSYWGICTKNNHIKLNWRLMAAPLAVIDYVVIHELAHIKHKNHSKRFWDLVARYNPDYKKHRKVLRSLRCPL